MRNKSNSLNLLAITIMAAICIGIVSCGDDDDSIDKIHNEGEQSVPSGEENSIQVITGDASDVTDNSVTLSGIISIKKGRADVMGFLIGESDNLKVSSYAKKVEIEENASTFSKNISGLTASTKYYYRVFSLFEDKYYYGEIKSFTTEKEKEALVKITVVSKDGMSLKIKFDPSSEVDYYYCGKGTSIRETTKYTESKTFTFSDLKPGQEYTFTVIAYTKDGKKNEPISEKFSTASPPYNNYLCYDGDFYQFTSAKTTVKYDYTSINNTGTNWRYFYLYISDYEFVQFSQGVHQWESVSSTWTSGEYNIESTSSYGAYGGVYYDGSRYHWFEEGTMTIKKQNGVTIVDFDCAGDWGSMFIGHAELN